MTKHLLAIITLVAMISMAAKATVTPASVVLADDEEVTYTCNPANKTQLTELSSFQVTYSTDMKKDWPEAVEVMRNGIKICGLSISISADKRTVTYTLDEKQTEDGTYTFRNLDWAACPTDFNIAAPLMKLTYYIGEPQELEPVFTTNPEQNKSLQSLRDILIMFQNVETLEVNPDKAVYVTNGTKVYDYYLTDVSDFMGMNVLALPVDENLSITAGGEYQLVIEKGALILNGKEYGYTLGFKVEEKLTLVSSIPAEGETTVAQLENITLTFNIPIISLTGYMMQALQLRQVDLETGDVMRNVADYMAQIDADNPKNVNLTAIDGVDIDEPGTYSLNLPPTLFVASSGKNLSQLLTFVIYDLDGIKSMLSDREAVNVYTTSGIKVIDNGTSDALNTLPKGLYIVNGRSMLIK